MELKEKEEEKENLIDSTISEENNSNFHLVQNNYDKKNNLSDILSIFGMLFFILIILLLITYCTFSIFNDKNENIIKGIYIKGIDVSGLSKDKALKKVTEYINQSIPDEITLTHSDYETTIPSSSINIDFDIEDAVNIAYNIGRDSNIFKNNFNVLKTLISNINIEPSFSIDENQLSSSLKDISSKLPDKMIDSSCYIDGNNLIITKGSSGYSFNVNETSNIIKDKIYNLSLNTPIELSV